MSASYEEARTANSFADLGSKALGFLRENQDGHNAYGIYPPGVVTTTATFVGESAWFRYGTRYIGRDSKSYQLGRKSQRCFVRTNG